MGKWMAAMSDVSVEDLVNSSSAEVRKLAKLVAQFNDAGFIAEAKSIHESARKIQSSLSAIQSVSDERVSACALSMEELTERIMEIAHERRGPSIAPDHDLFGDIEDGVSMGNDVPKLSPFAGLQDALTRGAKVGLAAGSADIFTNVAKKHLPEPVKQFLLQYPAAEGLVRLALPALTLAAVGKFGDKIPQADIVGQMAALAVEGATRDAVETMMQHGLPMLAEIAQLGAGAVKEAGAKAQLKANAGKSSGEPDDGIAMDEDDAPVKATVTCATDLEVDLADL